VEDEGIHGMPASPTHKKESRPAHRNAPTDSQPSVLTFGPAPLENHCTKFGPPGWAGRLSLILE
jgi:hypothetical protein